MLKSKYTGTIFFLALFTLFLAGSALASHPYGAKDFKLDAQHMKSHTIKFGDGISCSNDFVVQNLSNNPAEIQIVLGGLPFAREQIPGNEIKVYSLKKNLALAKLNGKPVGMDDWAFIINAIKDRTPIKVYCSH